MRRSIAGALLALAAGPVLAGDSRADATEAAEPAPAAKAIAIVDAGTGERVTAAPDTPAPARPTTPLPTGRTAAVPAPPASPATTGASIYERFVEGLAEPACDHASPRWRAHFAHVPGQLASDEGEVLPLFGYVVEALRSAHLPTEYALIPFVESGYRPAARSSSGPAGLWQFIALTARNLDVPVRGGYDGRLSPVDATRAAVRYLKTLHGMFAGDWRLAVMAFNTGEYRVLGALKRHDQRAADADPEALESLSGITRSYVRKLHALSCLMVEAGSNEAWTQSLQRPVTPLVAVELDDATGGLDGYASRNGLDPARLRRLNPALDNAASPKGRRILVPAAAAGATPAATGMAN